MVIGAHRKGQWLPMYAYVFMYALCVQPFGDLTFLPGGVSVHCIFFSLSTFKETFGVPAI